MLDDLKETAVLTPSWEVLREFLEGCENEILVCSPWISSHGVQHLADALATIPLLRSVTVWSRFAAPETDSPGLLRLARQLEPTVEHLEMRDLATLHAKIYMRDQRAVLLGSANLTEGGFHRNLEILAFSRSPTLVSGVCDFVDRFAPTLIPLTTAQLDNFVRTQYTEAHANGDDVHVEQPVPIWVQEAERSTARQTTSLNGADAGEHGTPNVEYTVSTVDPMELLTRAEEILERERPRLQAIDFDRLIDKRVTMRLYPARAAFEKTLFRMAIPFDDHVGKLMGKVDSIGAYATLSNACPEWRDAQLYRFRPLRRRKDIIVTPVFPLPEGVSGWAMLNAVPLFHIVSLTT